MRFCTELLKRGFAKMQKGGVVMDVTNAEQAAIAEEAGSVAVMALERVPADIRAAGTGDIIEAVRHVRLVNGAIAELKSKNKEQLYLIATKFADSYTVLLKEIRSAHGEPASVSEADVVFANENLDTITEGLFQILTEVKKIQRLPVVNFAAGGVATPADAALMMLMGCDGVFVGSGIFKSENPEGRGRAIVDAVAHFDDPSTVAEVSKGIGLAMKGMDAKALPVEARLQDRGW